MLRELRERQRKSAAEVSGAVEITESRLQEYELGKARPSEDVLMLLIQHFDLADEQAKELWRLAGYPNFDADEAQYFTNDDSGEVRTLSTIAPAQDMRIVYTDMVQVMVNNYGVIINFMQGSGLNNQPLAVARVGMSREHARSILQVLTKTLEQADNLQHRSPKRLPRRSETQD